MKRTLHIPQHCQDSLLNDGVFAAAYDALDPRRRAWLKKLAAELHCMLEPAHRIQGRYAVSWRSGFDSLWTVRPYSSGFVFIGEGVSSPAQVSAAALPLMFGGVREVVAVRVGRGAAEPDDVLAALELCGVEQVYALDAGDASACLNGVLDDPECACLGLNCRDLLPASGLEPKALFWSRREVEHMAVMVQEDGDFDPDVLAWAHPRATFTVFGGQGGHLPERFERGSGGVSGLAALGPQVVFSAMPLPGDIQVRIPLVLGPGQEGCFFWPELLERRMVKLSLDVRDENELETENGDPLL